MKRKSKPCPKGYNMNPKTGNCQEAVSMYQSKHSNIFPVMQRDVPDCCSNPDAHGTCYFGCVPCGEWINGVYEYEPGINCFEITGTIDCPAGSEMYAGTESYINDEGEPDVRAVWTSFQSEACLFKLEMMSGASVSNNCPEIYGSNNGSIGINCSCWAFKNYECPGQTAPAGCTIVGNDNYQFGSYNDDACAPPKGWNRKGGNIKRKFPTGGSLGPGDPNDPDMLNRLLTDAERISQLPSTHQRNALIRFRNKAQRHLDPFQTSPGSSYAKGGKLPQRTREEPEWSGCNDCMNNCFMQGNVCDGCHPYHPGGQCSCNQVCVNLSNDGQTCLQYQYCCYNNTPCAEECHSECGGVGQGYSGQHGGGGHGGPPSGGGHGEGPPKGWSGA